MTSALTITPTPRVPRTFLADDDHLLLAYLLGVIGRKYNRNVVRTEYYDGRRRVKSLGLAVSPEFNQIMTVCGWPGTCVDVLNERRAIDHLNIPESSDMEDALNAVWDDNDMPSEAPQLQLSEMLHGTAFVVVARDPEQDRTLVIPTPATRMTVEYDRYRRRITSAASNDEALRPGDPRQATLYMPDKTTVVELVGGRYRIVNEYENPSGIVPVERFVNRQRLDQPFGRTEITPAVISATDRAVRTLQAMEVSREFFAMPSQFALNVAEDSFVDEDGNKQSAWETYWGRFKALTGNLDDEGQPSPLQPDIKQLPASPPTPLIDMIKMDSQLVAAETGIPPSNLGFVTENPPSGDGMRMYENRLVKRAKMRNRMDGSSYGRTARLVLLAEGVPFDQLPKVQTIWEDEATFAQASTTDSVTKQVSSGILPADSDVALEELGYNRMTVERLQQDRRKARGAGVVAGLAQLAGRSAAAVNANQPAAPGVPAG